MMRMSDSEEIDARIRQLADEGLGNSDGTVSGKEQTKAIKNLRKALDTVADQMGNGDGKTSTGERSDYVEKYRKHPLIQRFKKQQS